MSQVRTTAQARASGQTTLQATEAVRLSRGGPKHCATILGAKAGGVHSVRCEGSGDYLFVVSEGWLQFAEVEVHGWGGGPGHGHGSARDMAVGMRSDVGFHADGAQHALTVPLQNVSVQWWVGVPYTTG